MPTRRAARPRRTPAPPKRSTRTRKKPERPRVVVVGFGRMGGALAIGLKRTGWPVTGAPRAVTVAASSCLEAGILSTLAMLHGEEAERFLGAEGAQAWVLR